MKQSAWILICLMLLHAAPVLSQNKPKTMLTDPAFTQIPDSVIQDLIGDWGGAGTSSGFQLHFLKDPALVTGQSSYIGLTGTWIWQGKTDSLLPAQPLTANAARLWRKESRRILLLLTYIGKTQTIIPAVFTFLDRDTGFFTLDTRNEFPLPIKPDPAIQRLLPKDITLKRVK